MDAGATILSFTFDVAACKLTSTDALCNATTQIDLRSDTCQMQNFNLTQDANQNWVCGGAPCNVQCTLSRDMPGP